MEQYNEEKIHRMEYLLLIRFITMYLWLPETEKRSLEDIEIHFSDPTKKWTDIYIRKNVINLKGQNGIEVAEQA